jgi:outer membrane protein assembly factor BamA
MVAQQIRLIPTAETAEEIRILEKLEYRPLHEDDKSARSEVDAIQGKLELLGFLDARLLTLTETDTTLTVHYRLGKRTERIRLHYVPQMGPADGKPENLILGLDDSNEILLPFEELPGYLQSLADQLERSGRSFSQVRLSDISVEGEVATARLLIADSRIRTIDKIVVRGYENFPESFIRRVLGLSEGSSFTKSKLDRASKAVTGISFAEETRPPEVLFTPDSTQVYLYLSRRRSNRFDGIIGFASKEESSGLEFNGYLDLDLNNIFNGGETISLYWKNNGEDRQRFNVQAEIPFVFNSPITPALNFELYRQDTTFSNVTADLSLSYLVNFKSQFALTLRTESSNDLRSLTNDSIAAYTNLFFGASYSLREPLDDEMFLSRYSLDVEAQVGSRKTDLEAVSQTRFSLLASYIWSLDRRNHIFIQNHSGFLNSSDYFENELFRVGGIYNLRGVNEESLFASAYSIFNLEYRYKASPTSYFYTISDFALIENQVDGEGFNVISFGLGYAFRTRAGILNLSYANGKFENSPFSFDNSKVHVKIISYF